MDNQSLYQPPLNAAEIELQVATARRYPRSIEGALNRILSIATLDEETAAECFYTLRRGGPADAQPIEGISVRFAEIVAANWGNLRALTEITANDGRALTARAYCHDLETNYAVAITVQRGVVDRYGRPYSPDMQILTGNAAMAIAFRNAVMKIVPKAVTGRVVQQIRGVAAQRVRNLEQSRAAMLAYFERLGVGAARVFAYLGVDTLDAIDARTIVELRGLANALDEGSLSLESIFPPAPAAPAADADDASPSAAATARRLLGKAAAAKTRAAAAMRPAHQPAVNPAAPPAAVTPPAAPAVSPAATAPAEPAI